MKDIPDIKDDAIAGPLASSGNRPAENPAEGDPSSWLTRVLTFVKTFPASLIARALTRELYIALSCGTVLCFIGAQSLNHSDISHVAPSSSINLKTDLLALLSGAAVAVFSSMGGISYIVYRGHGLDLEKIARCLDGIAGIIGLLASVFALPVGSAIMSLFGLETSGVWNALVVTATGLGVLVTVFFYCLILVLVLVLL